MTTNFYWLLPLSFLLLTSAYAEEERREPFAFSDFTWLNGNSRQKDFPLQTKYFTGQFQIDTNAVYSLRSPKDQTLVGSSNSGRTNELQVQQIGIGGDFNYQNVRGRLMTQFGMYSTMTPRNDASPSRGQWNLADGYRYISEAYGGYHWNILNGINLDAGIFMSYIGLCSYYNYENWVYQMSYVSANTPWFFNGARLQVFPTEKLKLELWLVNGWQSYGSFNNSPGVGTQVLWRPSGNWSFVTNDYYGRDTIGRPNRIRIHSDNSIQHKYFEKDGGGISRAAFSFTLDLGCETGDGVSCGIGNSSKPSQFFAGLMAYNRLWFNNNKYGLTLGGGAINNPGRYLVLVPPINGANATSGSAPYFTADPGNSFRAWDASATFDYMPSDHITWRLEVNHRHANVPYFAGHGGVTPTGGNQGAPGSVVAGFTPDLVKSESRVTGAMMVRF